MLGDAAARAAEQFAKRYGTAPKWIVAAPGRVNIIGEHIDYNDGFVLPMAIERYCVIAADSASDAAVHSAQIYSSATDETAAINLERPERHAVAGHWSNYFAGVVSGCNERGMRPDGFVAAVESGVPVGGGL